MGFLNQILSRFSRPAADPVVAAPSPAAPAAATVCTIEGCDVILHADGTLTWTAKAAIDGDGSGSSHGDPDFQGDTTLHHAGRALDSDVDKYIVVPPQVIQCVPGLVLGCQAQIVNTLNGRETAAVVGDIGPHAKIGEISIACARALGIDASPTTGGEDRHVIEYTIRPGSPAFVDDIAYQLQRAR